MHNFYLPSNQLIIWVVELHKIHMSSNWVCSLSLDEYERCHHYAFKKDREQFICCRFILRFLLSRYLKILPCEVILKYENQGKPYLAHHKFKRIQFNLTHTDEIMAIAITRHQAVGIDIESMTNLDDLVADRSIFTELERKQLQNSAVYNFWVAKEAFLKMKGYGLLHALNDIEVDIRSNQVVQLSTKQKADVAFFHYHKKCVGAIAIKKIPKQVLIKELILI